MSKHIATTIAAVRLMSEKETASDLSKKSDDKRHSENLASLLGMDDLSLEIGLQLIPPVSEQRGGRMLSRARALRRQLAGELGFLAPPIRISDDLRLKPPPRRLANSLKQLIRPNGFSASPVLPCQSPARDPLRWWLEPILPGVRVIAPAEIPPDVHLRPAGVVR